MLKKCFSILITIILILGMCINVNAAELKTKLDVITQASETKYLENDQGYISKTIVDSNAETGEVTIELKLSNTKKKQENSDNSHSNGKNSEIFIIIDESGSMYDKLANGKTRRETVREASKVLAKTILENYKNVKIGIIKFADGAEMTSVLTDNFEQINTAIDTYTGGSTDLYDALVLAKNSYSQSDTNKLAVILTDGAPNKASVNKDSEGNYISPKDITKQELMNLNNAGVSIITMMTELENENTAEGIFGTPETPTVGKYYYIADTEIEEVIANNIYSDIVDQIHVPNAEINTVKIVDYFPEDITENFEFSYIGDPSIGTVSEAIDEETKTITWDIGTLRGDETATLKYKLKIKDMKNAELLEKTIATNEKVVLTYKDAETKDYTVELTSSPKIKLTEVKEELTATVSYDPTSETTGSVTATITTNKKVNAVEGWTISEDGMTLTKEYKTNATETVHLVDLDGMTKDVEIKISNIIKEQPKEEPKNEPDNTLANKELPKTGKSIIMVITIITIITSLIVIYKKQSEYKDIK